MMTLYLTYWSLTAHMVTRLYLRSTASKPTPSQVTPLTLTVRASTTTDSSSAG
jgi:hypothetical protein